MTNLTPEDQKRVEEWQKLAREKLAPNVTYIDKKFAEVASWAQELLNAFWVEQQKDLDELLTTLLIQKNAEILAEQNKYDEAYAKGYRQARLDVEQEWTNRAPVNETINICQR